MVRPGHQICKLCTLYWTVVLGPDYNHHVYVQTAAKSMTSISELNNKICNCKTESLPLHNVTIEIEAIKYQER